MATNPVREALSDVKFEKRGDWMAEELRAVTKAYDFTLWLLPHLAKFSRDHRFTL